MLRQGLNWRHAVLFLALALSSCLLKCSPSCNPPLAHQLAVHQLEQDMENWCWAASAQMIMQFLATGPSQCDMANFELSMNDCCTLTAFGTYPDSCDKTGWPPFQHYGYNFQRTHYQALTFAQLQEQIGCKQKPVAFSRRLIENGSPVDKGHMFVAIGYHVDQAGNFVDVNDPSYATFLIMAYEEYVAVPGQTAHWDDFYDITKIN